MISNPSVDLKFEWVFNSSSERLDLQENLIEVRGTRSMARHTPQVREWVRIPQILSRTFRKIIFFIRRTERERERVGSKLLLLQPSPVVKGRVYI